MKETSSSTLHRIQMCERIVHFLKHKYKQTPWTTKQARWYMRTADDGHGRRRGRDLWSNAAVADDRTDGNDSWLREPKRILLSRYVGGFIFEWLALSTLSLLLMMQETPGSRVNWGSPDAVEAGGNATWGKYFDDDDLISYSYAFWIQESRAPGLFNTGDMLWWEW